MLNRPWWLGESKRWIDSEATANEIVTLLWSLPNNGGTKFRERNAGKGREGRGLEESSGVRHLDDPSSVRLQGRVERDRTA